MLEQGLQKLGGWKMISNPMLSCLQMSRNEEFSMQHEIFKDFVADVEIPVEVIGLLFVPGCVVIALLKSEFQSTELSVPYVTLITNDWFSKGETNTFVENVLTRGSWRQGYLNLKSGKGGDFKVQR